MATKAFFPFSNGKRDLVSKGDIIELENGEKFTFIEIKRTKWIGSDDSGKKFNIPIYRDKMGNNPFAKAIVGKNNNVIVKTQLNDLTPGDLFAL